MSERTLAKLYGTLTPLERVSLGIAALARGDESEVERLNSSAPRLRWNMVHHCGVQRALTFVALLYRADQLETIANYWHALNRIDWDADERAQWIKAAATSAYRFCVCADAWRRFCEEKGICSKDLLEGMPGELLTELCELSMPGVAPDRAEMAALLTDTTINSGGEVITVAHVSEQWRVLYNELLGDWPE